MPDDKITAEEVQRRIKDIEAIRARWKGDPAYLRTLDIDLAGLRLMAAFQTQRAAGLGRFD